jgi:hypothetical protein
MTRSGPLALIAITAALWVGLRGTYALFITALPQTVTPDATNVPRRLSPPEPETVRIATSVPRAANANSAEPKVLLAMTNARPPTMQGTLTLAASARSLAQADFRPPSSSSMVRNLTDNGSLEWGVGDGSSDAQAASPSNHRTGSIDFFAPQTAMTRESNRWAASSWLFVRPGGGSRANGLAGQSLLGGSQAGGRVAYRLDGPRRIEAFGRITTAGRRGDGVEGAVGIAVRPANEIPIQIAVERRAAIAGPGGRNAFAAYASGGVSDVALAAGWRLDGYGAAGIVGARRRDAFAEGSVDASRRIARLGSARLYAGGTMAGAVQPGASRLDVGPALTARLSPNGGNARIAIDYRARVAGNAEPASGITLTLAADF